MNVKIVKLNLHVFGKTNQIAKKLTYTVKESEQMQ